MRGRAKGKRIHRQRTLSKPQIIYYFSCIVRNRSNLEQQQQQMKLLSMNAYMKLQTEPQSDTFASTACSL